MNPLCNAADGQQLTEWCYVRALVCVNNPQHSSIPLPKFCCIFIQSEQSQLCHVQATGSLATWAAECGAAEVTIRPNNIDDNGFCVGLEAADGTYLGQKGWGRVNAAGLAADLSAPSTQRGLDCRLEQSSAGDAVVLRR